MITCEEQCCLKPRMVEGMDFTWICSVANSWSAARQEHGDKFSRNLSLSPRCVHSSSGKLEAARPISYRLLFCAFFAKVFSDPVKSNANASNNVALLPTCWLPAGFILSLTHWSRRLDAGSLKCVTAHNAKRASS